jgi:hypothetical protein
MGELAVITPSFAGDADLFEQLHRSVLEHTSEKTVHHVIVPTADRALFAPYSGPRCRVWTEPELLLRRYVRLPAVGFWLNVRRPWPPVRGWVLQQALKIAAAGIVDADAVLIADSDIVLVRPTNVRRFTVNGQLALYRCDHAIHAGMERHVRWHQAARRLLGLPGMPVPPLHDYVSSLNPWEPALVRAMQRRITEVSDSHWMEAITSEVHVSEFILYGLFVDEVVGVETPRPRLKSGFCHNYWDRTPLDLDGAHSFVDRMPQEAVGMMISSKSGTSLEVRTAAVQRGAPTTQ